MPDDFRYSVIRVDCQQARVTIEIHDYGGRASITLTRPQALAIANKILGHQPRGYIEHTIQVPPPCEDQYD